MAQIDTGKIAYCQIYPGVGIARIGNSPTEYFIGPETPGQTVAPGRRLQGQGGQDQAAGRAVPSLCLRQGQCLPRRGHRRRQGRHHLDRASRQRQGELQHVPRPVLAKPVSELLQIQSERDAAAQPGDHGSRRATEAARHRSRSTLDQTRRRAGGVRHRHHRAAALFGHRAGTPTIRWKVRATAGGTVRPRINCQSR